MVFVGCFSVEYFMSKSCEAYKHVDFEDRHIFTAVTLLVFILLTQVQMQCFISVMLLLCFVSSLCIYYIHYIHYIHLFT